MKIRTVEELNNKLSDDLVWRKKELAAIKSLIATRSFALQKHKALVRSGVCILYAHWEGFIKFAANAYLDFVGFYITSKNLKYQEISSNFVALAMKEKLAAAKETNKPSLYIPVCDFLRFELDQK